MVGRREKAESPMFRSHPWFPVTRPVPSSPGSPCLFAWSRSHRAPIPMRFVVLSNGTSNTEPPAKRARVVGGDVIKDEEDMRNVFHGCAINGDIQINISRALKF
ncbi:hypothetical protein EYF80_042175 [Liparis tanakae]|uniref:Uncharacterized protein n=1 Tax=Liparis tanakae TaxID=230148 RepID=A0A4Z2G4B4_9TELE|nr:hypothetical protein EYF80_042175 [Liparis tanakae]